MPLQILRFHRRVSFPAAALLILAIGLGSPAEASAAGEWTTGCTPTKGFMQTNGTVTVGVTAPPILGESIDGRKITADTFKGRPVLLDFGSISCASCKDTIKEFRRLQDVYKGTDLELVIVVNGSATVKKLKDHFSGMGATYTVIRDNGYSIFDGFGVSNIPFQVVIDRGGKVRKIHVGFDPAMETAMGLKELVRK